MPLSLSLTFSSSSNYKFNKYLTNCDLINKFNIKNISQKPQLTKVILEFTFQDILLNCNNTNKEEWDSDLQVKSFLLLYILQSNYPFINLNNFKINKNNCSIKIIISSEEYLQLLLITLFVENLDVLIEKGLSFTEILNKHNNFIQNDKELIINTKIPASLFIELDTLINNEISGINLKDLNMKASFAFSKKIIGKKSLFYFKNLFPFWIK
jgi:hypothetical protein